MPHLASSYTGFFARRDGFPAGGAVGDVLMLDASLSPEWGASTPGPPGAGDVEFLELVTGYTGGGATKLDGVNGTGVTVPKLYGFEHATEGLRFYLMRAGTEVTASPGIIRVADYAPGANEKIFESVL